MARLRWPVARSDSNTASSTSSARPAKAEMASSTRARRASRVAPATSDEVAMAPALIIGFIGRPVPGSRLMELKASPEGSTPTACRTRASPRSSSATP